MATVRPRSILASSRPTPAYGGIQLDEAVVRDLAERVGRGVVPMNFHHDLSRTVEVSNIASGT